MSVQPMADYRPRHSWGDARLSTTHAQLAARLIVVDAAPHSNPLYVGRHHAEAAPFFDITEGDWQVLAEPTDTPGGARIRFWHRGEPFRDFGFPAYKVWNISAHFADFIAEFEYDLAHPESVQS